MTLVKLFEEFIKVSDYKKWSKYTNWEFYKEMGEKFKQFKDHDRNYNRVYFKLKIDPTKFKVEPPQELYDYLRWNRYSIKDYSKGICIDGDGNERKIGKVLNDRNQPDLLKLYSDSKTDSLKNVNDLMVVISRHPYDIIGMSTNRGFKTCHDLNDQRYGGLHLGGIRGTLERGALIAYLIRENDKNIQNPISRILIKKYAFDDELIPDVTYGTRVQEFTQFVHHFCEKIYPVR